MGTGQTLLTIMATMMLGRLILSVNTGTAESGAAIEMSAYRITGTSLGTSILEEASGMAFDEATVASDINSTSLLSTTLGPESGEVYPDFDDYDDFNGLTKVDSLQSSAVFTTKVKVEYVSISGSAIVVSATPTYNKRITVKVSSPSMTDTLKFYDVYSYWYFR
jgi:MSHA pilin protein MshD